MNSEEMQALGRVIEHYGHEEVKHWQASGEPPGHIAEAVLALERYRQAALETDNGEKGQATNLTINESELEAIRSVVEYLAAKIHEDNRGPDAPIQRDAATLARLLGRLATTSPAEEVASRRNGGHDPQRSMPGQGDSCLIYMIGHADRFADSVIGKYGQISAGCGGTFVEDFAKTRWPVVVKAKPDVIEGDLIQHLRDLADLLENYIKPENRQRTLADGRCPECGIRKANGEAICMCCGRTI